MDIVFLSISLTATSGRSPRFGENDRGPFNYVTAGQSIRRFKRRHAARGLAKQESSVGATLSGSISSVILAFIRQPDGRTRNFAESLRLDSWRVYRRY